MQISAPNEQLCEALKPVSARFEQVITVSNAES
jgi:hypothetical protein